LYIGGSSVVTIEGAGSELSRTLIFSTGYKLDAHPVLMLGAENTHPLDIMTIKATQTMHKVFKPLPVTKTRRAMMK
jgi:hypothetical protein